MKKRNPNDATFRNINKLKKDFAVMVIHIKLMDKTLDALVDMVMKIYTKINKYERKLKKK